MTVTEQPPTSPPAQRGGAGRRRPPRTPKGRQVDPQAHEEVLALLTDRPRRRDLLIEHLHLIQDHYGHLSAAHLAALAQEMKLALTEVYEVATFYAHFDVVKEGQTPPPPVTVRVCNSLSCALKGAERLLDELPSKLGANVRVVRAPCMGACDRAPVCAVGHVQVMQADAAKVVAAAAKPAHAHTYPTPNAFDAYVRGGGYDLLKACLGGTRTRDDIIKIGQRCRPARPRRRRISHRPQMVAGARRAGAAAVRGQCRRGRAGHVQGPLLSRTRSAPLHRRHADRRLDRRSRRYLSLRARRISGSAAAAHRRDRQGRGGGSVRSTPRFICAAAPVLISAAKNRR